VADAPGLLKSGVLWLKVKADCGTVRSTCETGTSCFVGRSLRRVIDALAKEEVNFGLLSAILEANCSGAKAVCSVCEPGAGSVEERDAKRFSSFGFRVSYEAAIKSRDGIQTAEVELTANYTTSTLHHIILPIFTHLPTSGRLGLTLTMTTTTVTAACHCWSKSLAGKSNSSRHL